MLPSKKLFVCSLCILFSINVFAQHVELYYGPNLLKFYTTDGGTVGELEDFYDQHNNGVSLGVLVDYSQSKARLPSFSLQIDQFAGYINLRSFDHDSEVYFSNTNISMAVYILNKAFFDKLLVHSGFEISGTVKETFEGSLGKYDSNNNWTKQDITQDNFEITNPVSVGFKTRISYAFKLKERISFRPQYAFSLGLNRDFSIDQNALNSYRHFFAIGFSYKLQ